jgi:hypothetical protein
VDPDAGVEALGQNDAVGEGSPEARGNREPVLGIEAVLVKTSEGHLAGSFLKRGRKTKTKMDRSDEVGGTSPPRSWASTRLPQ